MKLEIVDSKGESTGQVEIAEDLLVLDRGDQALHDAVIAQHAAGRAGTASTRTKGEVAGTGSKPHRQKGLGRARAGYSQSPVWRGGGVAFGPKPRSYRAKVNKQSRRLAFRRALSDKLSGDSFKVIDKIELAEPRTRGLVAQLDSLGVDTDVLLVVGDVDRNLGLAARNLQGVGLVAARDLNTRQVLDFPAIIATVEAMDVLKRRLAGKEKSE